MLLLIVGNRKVQLWGRLQGYNIDKTFNENLSTGSKDATKEHTQSTVMS
jgi:hypothetical protein